MARLNGYAMAQFEVPMAGSLRPRGLPAVHSSKPTAEGEILSRIAAGLGPANPAVAKVLPMIPTPGVQGVQVQIWGLLSRKGSLRPPTGKLKVDTGISTHYSRRSGVNAGATPGGSTVRARNRRPMSKNAVLRRADLTVPSSSAIISQ